MAPLKEYSVPSIERALSMLECLAQSKKRVFNFRNRSKAQDTEKLGASDPNHPGTARIPSEEYADRKISFWPAVG